jgi:hypothetical protein
VRVYTVVVLDDKGETVAVLDVVETVTVEGLGELGNE